MLACRFDFPGQWPTLLSDLGGAAAWGSPMHAVAKLRMLFTLKNVLRALRSKRFVVEAPSSVAGLSPEGDLSPQPLAQAPTTLHSSKVHTPPAPFYSHGQWWHGYLVAHSLCRPSLCRRVMVRLHIHH